MTNKGKYVYFMRPVGMEGPIKIGCTLYPHHRLVQLTIWSPFKLEILHMEEGSHTLERNLHKCFADCHSHHEWFHPEPRLLEAISKFKSGMKIADVIDLTDERGSIHANRPQVPEVLIGYRSLTMKLTWALKRARAKSKHHVHIPRDIDRIMAAWSGVWSYNVRTEPVRPTAEQFKRVQEFIDDPHSHCVTEEQRFPKEQKLKKAAA
ncbi:GIY-YIG nuclease family protein [Rhizobium leguminosarum]|uniref:GIY-YIG nuclease family protein n=1 Tax=Rhizobium leguminosarum TaxID=384 RepID=UPI00293DB4F5|nr:GIY-YIG nuclease family protein [Rhizobium leguminosarum]MDV4166222.1 GIY-YIG nuclease family protein [Rhizobium leguminosarum]